MLIGIIGENCAGKSTLADAMKTELNAKIFSGKDYLRLAKSESEAKAVFRQILREAVSGENVICVISEPEQLDLLPEGAKHVLVRTDLATIKARFRARMHGTLPPAVEAMLERKHGVFDHLDSDAVLDGASDALPDGKRLLNMLNLQGEK